MKEESTTDCISARAKPVNWLRNPVMELKSSSGRNDCAVRGVYGRNMLLRGTDEINIYVAVGCGAGIS